MKLWSVRLATIGASPSNAKFEMLVIGNTKVPKPEPFDMLF